MKRILNAIIMFLAAITLMAQNSFVVVDRNGNSKLVQDLIFQQKSGAFSWGSSFDGYQQDQDIKDLLFIARAKNTLATGSAEEVTQMLEELSGTDQADAEAVASAIKNNPNVAEAFSADGNNVAIRCRVDEGLRYYPLYKQESLFSESDFSDGDEMFLSRAQKAYASNVKVAIFNFFNGSPFYYSQNRLINKIKSWFKGHGYVVDEFGPGADKPFTQSALQRVCDINIADNMHYQAIFVFTHGALDKNGDPYICSKEFAQNGEDGIVDPIDHKAYKMIPVKQTFKAVRSDCLVYLGACDSAPRGGYDMNEFSTYDSKIIGWSGRTRIGQAYAALMTYFMLYGDYSWNNVYYSLPRDDNSASIKISHGISENGLWLQSAGYARLDYNNDISATVEKPNKTKRREYFEVTIHVSDNKWQRKVHGYIVNLTSMVKSEIKLERKHIYDSQNNKFIWYFPEELYNEHGLYCLEIREETNFVDTNNKPIKLNKPIYIIKSDQYRETGGDIVSEEDIATPVILGSNGQSVDEISVAKGSTQTYSIDGYEGHTFRVATLDTDVVNVSVSGKTLTVKGVSEGSTYIGVMDEQNKLMAVAEVTVTAGGDTPGPGGDVTAYTACPDANHPHWIDLGIGTLWRCCNEGASTPEEYGDYYTFDQAQAYNPPSSDQIEALVNNCSYTWTTQNGVKGGKFTGPNGGTIFLPAAGYVWDGELYDVGSYGDHWSSTPFDEYGACRLDFNWGYVRTSYYFRDNGLSVRPVLKNSSPTLSVSTTSLSITEGETSTVDITSGSGEYGVTNLNSDIAKATLDGTRITVNAIAAGEAEIVVTDMQTKQEIIIKITVTANSSGNTSAGLQAVDLGLPSGTLWANMNVGAEKPEDYGLYFAWGETTGYTGDTSDGHTFDWASYKWCNGSETTLTKYCTNSDYGTVDNETVLEPEDDAAHVNWGGSWRMPTLADIEELFDNTTNEWTTQNGVNGRKFTSKTNGNSIFLPAAGYRWGSDLSYAGSYGIYWPSTPSNEYYACRLSFSSSFARWSYDFGSRALGYSVRPVR